MNKKNFSESYIIINIIFAGIILLVIIYSGIFSAQKANHPISSYCPNQPCASTGLSRSFSEIVRFKFESAKKYNSNGLAIFLFFFIQFWLRILFSIIYHKNKTSFKTIIITDSTISLILFFFAFKNFIILMLK
ncbi:MAG: hypothetical protein A2X08_04155 [Bacteroidetes bacterium GWA2_32_17]|nr:MAG: hypothetical protein A2X08_04155 [Bacteroidetes bacterium GWA2_32_17]